MSESKKSSNIFGTCSCALGSAAIRHQNASALAFDAGQRRDFGEHRFRDRAVHLDECDRGAALAVAAECECRDIDRGIAEKARETADETRLVFIADVNHHGRDQRVDFDPIDRNDARLSIVKNSAGDQALAVLRLRP